MKNMKIFKNGLMIMMVAFLFGSCTIVPPGEVGIKVNNWGDNRGVSNLTLSTGMVSYNPITSSVLKWPTFVQTAMWTSRIDEGNPVDESITFNTKEGTQVSADVSLSYQLTESKIPAFYVKFRTDNLESWTMGYLHNVARDKFQEIGGKYELDSLYGPGKEKFLKEVKEATNAFITTEGATITQFGFTGPLRMDTTILNALNRKLKNVQDAIAARNKILTIDAEAEQVRHAAQGKADANIILTASMTPMLIEWERLQVQKYWIDKWNAQLPTTMVGTSANMMMNMNGSTPTK